MSLVRMALRHAAVAALRDRTWAQERVFDSDNTPLGQALIVDAPAKPYVVVYTDADTRYEFSGREVNANRRNVALVIEFAVASAVSVENVTTTVIPNSDPGMEIALDIVEHQVLQALFADPRSKWGEMVRKFVLSIVRMPSARGGAGEHGSKWAARQLTIVCDIVSDPPFGTPVKETHPLKQFIALATATGGAVSQAASLLQMALDSQPDDYPSWEQAQAWLSTSKGGIRGIGLAPLTQVDAGAGSSINPLDVGPDADDVTTHEGPGLEEIAIAQEDDGTTLVQPEIPEEP